MEFRVLGPLKVSDGDVPVVISRRRCQALLALLISRYPDPVSTDVAADALWPEADADRATNSARVHATHLRGALGERIMPKAAGRYMLMVERDQIDATRFEDALAIARTAASAGDPRRATELYASALAEWRGPPYADFPDVDVLREEVARLGEVYLDAIEGFGTALLDDDRPDEVCRLLGPVFDTHPDREALAARLVLGLHRAGRTRDALAVIGRVKEHLGESGMVASSALLELADSIVLQTPGISSRPIGFSPGRTTLLARRPAAFIGREREIRALCAAWESAREGAPQLAYVTGTAGIGKTSVIARFVEVIEAEGGGVILRSACDHDTSEDYQPFPDLVRSILAEDPPADIGPGVLGELVRLTPEMSRRLPDAAEAPEPGAGRQRLFGAVSELLAVPSQPRLIVIEDLHWARPDALLMLRHVLRNARGQLMILASFRDDEIEASTPFGEASSSGRLGRPDVHVPMDAMNQHEIAAVIDAVAPGERRTEWLDSLHGLVEVSAGNPLRLREVLRQLELEPGAEIAEIAPDDVRGLVARRLRALNPQTCAALQAASVLGRTFSLPVVAAATGLSPSATLDALEEALAQGLIVEDAVVDDFMFAHPLFRNAIYYSLSKSRRARLHLRCGRVIADARVTTTDGRRAAEVARHFVAARPISDPNRTAELARKAGRDADERYAHEESVVWYRHVTDAATAAGWTDPEIARVRLDLGGALERAGSADAARDEFLLAAAIAVQARDLDLLCDAISAATPPFTVLERQYADRLGRLADIALEWLDHDDHRRITVLRAAAFARLYWDHAALPAYADEAVTLARVSDDAELQHRAMVVEYVASYGRPISDRLELSREIRDHCQRAGLRSELGMATRRLLNDLLQIGAIDAFDELRAAFARDGRTTSMPFEIYWSEALVATRELMRTATRDTEGLIDAAATVGRRLQMPDADGVQLLQTFALRYQQRRAREVAGNLSTPNDADPKVLAGTGLLALTFAEAGRLESARRMLDRVVDSVAVKLPHDNFWFGGVSLFAGVAAACGSRAQRAVLRAALEPRSEHFCLFGAAGAVFGTGHHWLARLASADDDPDAARKHLAHAAQICDDADAPFWAGRAREEFRVLTGSDLP